MPEQLTGYAFNKTRQTFLATDLKVAHTHWTRLRGLMGVRTTRFGFGQGLWIVPCHGVHTWLMRFPIDVVYLSSENVVVHVEENVRPWRFASVRMEASSVLEIPAHTVFNSGTEIGDVFEVKVNGAAKKSAAA